MTRGYIEQVATGPQLRPSLWAMLEAFGKWLSAVAGILLVISVPALVEGFRSEDAWFLVIMENMQIGVSLLVPLVPAVRVAFTTYSFDERGVRVRSQVLATLDHRIPWDKVTAVRQRRTLVDRIVGTTRIEVIAYGVRGATLRLVGLHDGKAVRDLVARTMREHCTALAFQDSD